MNVAVAKFDPVTEAGLARAGLSRSVADARQVDTQHAAAELTRQKAGWPALPFRVWD